MKIVTLMENTSCREDICFEHGLSLYLETQGRKILFDAGQSAAFADNAQLLGVDLEEVDFAVLSHGHYDHSGGFNKFLEINASAPVYVSQWAFEPHWESDGRYVGVDLSLGESDRIRYVAEETVLAEGITLYRMHKVCLDIREQRQVSAVKCTAHIRGVNTGQGLLRIRERLHAFTLRNRISRQLLKARNHYQGSCNHCRSLSEYVIYFLHHIFHSFRTSDPDQK